MESFRHHGFIMRLKAAIIYTLARDITNNNSGKDAARLLFGHHPMVEGVSVPGSGWLTDYLRGIRVSPVLPEKSR